MRKFITNNPDIFKLILDQAGEEFYLVNPDGSLAYVNEAAAQSLGYTVEEMLKMGVPDFDLMVGSDYSAHFKKLKRGNLPSFRTIQVAKDGQQILKEIKSVHLRIGENEYACGFGRDISQQVHMEENLRASEERFRRLVENLQEEYFFYVHDKEGVFVYLSPSISNILGYSQEEFLSHYTDYLTKNSINDAVIQHTELSLQGIEQPSYEVEILHKNGEIRRVEVKETPVFDPKGNVVGVEGIAHDVTQRQQVMEEMAQKTSELKEVNSAMRVLLRQSADAQKELEEKVLANLRELVVPHLEELEVQLSSKQERVHLKIIKANLEQITSSFSRGLTLRAPSLTPREMQVANFVRNGRSNKEIASLLNLSQRTVEFYRDNLRKKLKIKNKKINLRSYLLSEL